MSENREKTFISRRGFIKGTAAGVGSLALVHLGGREVQAAPPPKKWDREVNVLIIGCGVAGCAAAIAASDAGEKSVLVLEKMPYPGGAGLLSSGTVMAAGTDLQKAAGIQDSNELYWKHGHPKQASAKAMDVAAARKLWDLSEQMCGMSMEVQHGIR